MVWFGVCWKERFSKPAVNAAGGPNKVLFYDPEDVIINFVRLKCKSITKNLLFLVIIGILNCMKHALGHAFARARPAALRKDYSSVFKGNVIPSVRYLLIIEKVYVRKDSGSLVHVYKDCLLYFTGRCY